MENGSSNIIVSAFIVTGKNRTAIVPIVQPHKAIFELSGIGRVDSFDLEINFSADIDKFRTHDYRWVEPGNCISSPFAPKVISIGRKFVQPSNPVGIWEISKSNTRQLRWRFNPEGAAELTVYGKAHVKNTVRSVVDFPSSVSLLLANDAVELSRSPLPFSAVACFTDHCDFDTLDSLIRQREFFKVAGIKVTKGFFLNHFSKRADNASFENHANELGKWRDDGHELAYHSLSQSIKNNSESLDDFRNFKPPFPNLPTWIDHGYQPYNLSLYAHKLSDSVYSEIIRRKGIRTLWNYIDSGTTTTGVINQLNPDDFTLAKFSAGNSNLGFKARIGQLIKNVMFHHYADERIISNYKNTAGNLKGVVYQKKIRNILPAAGNLSKLSIPLLKVFVGWSGRKNQPYKFAKYSPVIFKHHIAGRAFTVFQTVEMIDFVRSLSKINIDKLIDESGLFIAHTYFSVPAVYHHGKMFSTPETIDSQVAANFSYLGDKIREKEIWNPTLAELVEFLAKFENTVIDVDSSGNLVVDSPVPYRTIT